MQETKHEATYWKRLAMLTVVAMVMAAVLIPSYVGFSQSNPQARILVVRENKAGRSVAGPVYLGEDPLRLVRAHACGSLLTPHTVTRHNLRGRATDQLDVGLFGATYLAASL